MTIRNPIVSGRFYSDNPEELQRTLKRFLHPQPHYQALAAIVPHAGYIYSGGVAGAVYSSMLLPDCFVILCPNHTGRGAPFALWPKGQWKTPLGLVEVNEQLALQIQDRCSFLEVSLQAHELEHSVEVQLPFLQSLLPAFSIVPICIRDVSPPKLLELGNALAEAIRSYGHRVLVIASSDMNHYEQESITRLKDQKAMDRILALDPFGLYQTVLNESISMCGIGPAVAAMQAAKQLGASEGVLVKYSTSGEISGDFYRVVGYAGMVIV